LDTEDQKSNGTSINNGLSKLVIVFGDARKSKGSSLLYGRIELFKAVNKGIKSTRVNNSFSKMWGVLSNGSKNVGGSFLVESLYQLKII
jgi:hypothetical protein